MSNDDGGPTSSSLIQCVLHDALGLRVQRARGLIEEQDGRVRDNSPGDRNPLFLSTREQETAFSNGGSIPFRQRRDEAVRIRLDARLLDGSHPLLVACLLQGSAREAHLDVVPDRHGEEDGFLRDEADLRAQPLDVEVLDVRVVQLDDPTQRVVEPLDEGDDGALPAARGANQRSRLARFEHEAYSLEDFDVWAGRVVELDVLELDLAHDLFRCETGRICGVDGGDAVDGGEEFGCCTHGGGYGCDLGSEHCEREGADHDREEDSDHRAGVNYYTVVSVLLVNRKHLEGLTLSCKNQGRSKLES